MRSDIKTVSRRVILILAAVAYSLAAITLAIAQAGGTTPFTGVWETVAGSSYRYTVRLTQIGKKVSGTFSPGNGKISEGVVTGDKLTFKWTQDGGYEGTGEFTLDGDGKGFTGSSTAIKPAAQTHSWNTYKPDPPLSFAGTWAIWKLDAERNTSITLSMSQNGNKVTGTYPAENGTIEGTVIGRNLRFKWESDAGSGTGLFNMSTFGPRFGGWFNTGTDPDIEGTRWQGELKTATGGASSPEEVPDAAASGPVSFSTCWKLSGGMISGQTICLKQDDGGRVTDDDRFEGTISGNTLRFTHRPGGDYRSGRLIMDKGGKSFRGFWHSGNDTESDEAPCTGVAVDKRIGTGTQAFTGVWKIVEGGVQGSLVIKQLGPIATGVYVTNRGGYQLTNGNVTGNTLRFTLIGRTNIGVVSVGELVLEPDGKSFKGNISGVPVAGTFDRP